MTTCIHGEENCVRCAINPVEAPTIHLHVILDVSPSMANRWTQTISGLNEYMDSLRKDQSDNSQAYKVTLTTFSADITELYKDVELDSIPTFTEKNLQRTGWGTALYDGVGKTVKAINTTEPVLVVIITDGEENSSHSWNEGTIGVLMDERQKLGNYTYAYLGVGKEAWGNATRLGATVAKVGAYSNMQESHYSSGTFTNTTNSLGTRTAMYSSAMRSAHAKGSSMNVNAFFVPEDNTEDDTNTVAVTNASGTGNK